MALVIFQLKCGFHVRRLVSCRRFETSSPMPVQLLLLRDQWMQGGDADVNAELGEKRQLM